MLQGQPPMISVTCIHKHALTTGRPFDSPQVPSHVCHSLQCTGEHPMANTACVLRLTVLSKAGRGRQAEAGDHRSGTTYMSLSFCIVPHSAGRVLVNRLPDRSLQQTNSQTCSVSQPQADVQEPPCARSMSFTVRVAIKYAAVCGGQSNVMLGRHGSRWEPLRMPADLMNCTDSAEAG